MIGFRLCGIAELLLLPLGKVFFNFKNLRALEMAELGCPAINGTRDESEHAHELGVTVSLLDNLRVERAAALRPSFSQTYFSTFGSR